MKFNFKNNIRKITSYIIAITMLMPIVTLSGFSAVDTSDNIGSEYNSYESPFNVPMILDDLSPELAKTAKLDISDVPDIIDMEDVLLQKHVKRLYQQEWDEYTVIFQNSDFSKTIYIFSDPIKNDDLMASLNNEKMIKAHTDGQSEKIQLLNKSFVQKLGSTEEGGIMPYNIGSCSVRYTPGYPTHNNKMTFTEDLTNELRDLSKKLSSTEDEETPDVIEISKELTTTSIFSGESDGLICLVINISPIGGDYLIKSEHDNKYLTNKSGELSVEKQKEKMASRWLIQARGGDTFAVTSISDMTKNISLSEEGALHLDSSAEDVWTISFLSGNESCFVLSKDGECVNNINGNVKMDISAGQTQNVQLWKFYDFRPFIAVNEISIYSEADTPIGVLTISPDEEVTLKAKCIPTFASYADVVCSEYFDCVNTDLNAVVSDKGVSSFKVKGKDNNGEEKSETITFSLANNIGITTSVKVNILNLLSNGYDKTILNIESAFKENPSDPPNALAYSDDYEFFLSLPELSPDQSQQQFYFESYGSNYIIKSIHKEKILSIFGWEYNTTPIATNMLWNIYNSGSNVVVKNVYNQYLLTLYYEGDNLVPSISSSDIDEYSKWNLRYSGIVKIKNAGNGQYMTVQHGFDTDKRNGSNPIDVFIHLKDNITNDVNNQIASQLFKIKYEDGAYRLYPLCSLNGMRRVIGKHVSDGNNRISLMDREVNPSADYFSINKNRANKYYFYCGNAGYLCASENVNNTDDAGFLQTSSDLQLDNGYWDIEFQKDESCKEAYYKDMHFEFPINRSSLTITSGFGYRKYNGEGVHYGMDISVYRANVCSIAEGKVVVQTVTNDFQTGYRVIIELDPNKYRAYGSNDKIYVEFMHLAAPTNNLVGQSCNSNTVVAISSGTGGSINYDPHLHMQIFTMSELVFNQNKINESSIDPLLFYDYEELGFGTNLDTDSVIIGEEIQ